MGFTYHFIVLHGLQGPPTAQAAEAVATTAVLSRLRSETYQYYTLPFCQHKEGKKYVTEDLGEVLEGDRLVNTPYDIKFRQDVENQVLCTKKLTGNDLYNIRMAIAEDYYFQVCSTGISGHSRCMFGLLRGPEVSAGVAAAEAAVQRFNQSIDRVADGLLSWDSPDLSCGPRNCAHAAAAGGAMCSCRARLLKLPMTSNPLCMSILCCADVL